MPIAKELFDKNLLARCIEEVLADEDFNQEKILSMGFFMAVMTKLNEHMGGELVKTPGYKESIWPVMKNEIKKILDEKKVSYNVDAAKDQLKMSRAILNGAKHHELRNKQPE